MPDRLRNDETQAPPDTGEPLWSGVTPARPPPPRERYQVVGEIARGGIGRVMEAWDRELERPVALKELLRDSPANRARFHREILFTARLQHPAIVPIYEVIQLPDGREQYAMKLVSGRTLDAAAAAATSVEERLALLPHVLAVADALAYAHTRGVIHRDVKPQNVLVGTFGETVLIDWGVAKDVRAEDDGGGDTGEDPTQAALTHAGAIVGTPAYMAPEQARGEPADFRADVYALGATLYHVLSGAPPYADETARTLEALLVGRPPDPLEARAPGVPDDLLSIVRRAMAPDRADRYPTAEQLSADLHRFSTGQLVAARRYTPADLLRRWLAQHRALVSVVAASAVILGIVGVASARRVVRERDAAEAARQVAQARTNALVLVQARRAAEDDPTEAASWLAEYPPDAPDWGGVLRIAQDVVSRGVAAIAVRHGTDTCDRVVWGADGATLYPTGVEVGPADPTTGALLGAYGLSRGETVVPLPDGGALALGGAGQLVRVGRDRVSTTVGELGGAPLVATVAGHTAVIGDRAGRVTLFDLDHATGRALPLGGSRVSGVVVRGDRWVASLGEGEVYQGDVAGGEARLLRRHPVGVEKLVGTPDGRSVLLGDAAGAVYDLDAPSRPILTLPSAITLLAVSADGRFVAAAEGGSTLVALDRTTGRTFSAPWPASRAIGLTFAPAGDLLAASLQDGTLRLWRPSTGDVAVRRATPAMHRAAAFRPDGAAFATCGVDGSMRVWPTPTLTATRFRGHEDRVFHVRFLADGGVVSDSDDRTVRAWWPGAPGEPTRPPAVMRIHEDRVYGLDVAPDGRRVVSASQDGRAVVWEPATGATAVLARQAGRVFRAAWLPDGERVLTATADGVLTLWSATGEELREVQAHQGAARWVVPSPDGHAAWSVGGDNTLRRWDLDTGELTTLADHLSADGTLALRAHLLADGEVATCDAGVGIVIAGAHGLRRVPYPGPAGCSSMVVAADGRTLGIPDGPTLRLLDLSTGTLRDLATFDEDIHAIAFSRDGRLAAATTLDGTTRVIRMADGAAYVAWRGEGPALAVAFSPDSRRLATSGVEPVVWVGDIDDAAFLPPDPAALRARVQALTMAKAPG